MAGRILLEDAYDCAQSWFVTFTYAPQYQPAGFEKGWIQAFHKYVREDLASLNCKMRFFFTCEYGDEKGKSHYHAIYLLDRRFDDIPDMEPFVSVGPDGGVFTEPYNEFKDIIRSNWKRRGIPSLGFVYFGSLTAASAKYCTAYALKDDDWYHDNMQALAEGKIPPENVPFRLFSRKPGLGCTPKTLAAVQDYAYHDVQHIRKRISLDSATKFPVPAVYRQRLDDLEVREAATQLGLDYFQENQAALATNYERNTSYCEVENPFGDKMLVRIPDYTIDEEIYQQKREIRILRKTAKKAFYAQKNLPNI